MVYNPNIPQPDDNPSESQLQLLSNFQQLLLAFLQNHVTLNASGEGKHKFLQMPEQTDAPTTGADEGALYTKDDNGQTVLFYRGANDGEEVPLGGGNPSQTGSDYSWDLPGGLQIRFGIAVLLANTTSVNVTFPSPFSNNAYVGFLTYAGPLVSSNALTVFSLTTTEISIHSPRATSDRSINYISFGS